MGMVLPPANLVAQSVYWLLKEGHDVKPGAVPMAAFEDLDADVRQMHVDNVERVYRAIDCCTAQEVDVEHPRHG